jgi:molybdopterin-guanine dinucleotide biosynthesis protein A
LLGSPRSQREGRIAAVTGCIAGAERGTRAVRLATLLDSLFAEVLWVGTEPAPGAPGRAVPAADGPASPLRDLVGALQAAETDSVLVVSGALDRVTPSLLLALFAWPEAEAVVPRTPRGPWPLCALYRREAALPAARQSLAAGALDPEPVLAGIETSYLEGADLAAVAPEFAARVD